MSLNKYKFVWLEIVLAMASAASAEWKEKVLWACGVLYSPAGCGLSCSPSPANPLK